jgi:transposase-like protein
MTEESTKINRKERTGKQLERQERCFRLSIEQNKSMREIALELGITNNTVASDIRAELERRHKENADQRKYEVTRAVAFYERMIALALTFEPDEEDAEKDRIKRIPDRSINTAIKARERIDKILGLEAPTKMEIDSVQAMTRAQRDEEIVEQENLLAERSRIQAEESAAKNP